MFGENVKSSFIEMNERLFLQTLLPIYAQYNEHKLDFLRGNIGIEIWEF